MSRRISRGDRLTAATQSTLRRSHARPVFLDLGGRRLFGLQIVPSGPCAGAILYLPPFAEEMNRCRSHAVAQARAMAQRGWHVLLLDPSGTGESEGQFADATWVQWRDDAAAAMDWLHRQTGRPVSLWGLRTGALLAAELVQCGVPDGTRLLFWQPVLDGRQFLQQYLRLRIASQMMRDGDRETVDSLRARLNAGEIIEIAGYPLGGTLAEELSARRMTDFPALAKQQLGWMEVVARADQPMAAASRSLIENLRSAGARIATVAVADPMIWQLQEREDAPHLQQASLDLLGETP